MPLLRRHVVTERLKDGSIKNWMRSDLCSLLMVLNINYLLILNKVLDLHIINMYNISMFSAPGGLTH
jgi:hypothetical protein